MVDYEKLYALLFNAITDAIYECEAGKTQQAVLRLEAAQKKAEELYITQ